MSAPSAEELLSQLEAVARHLTPTDRLELIDRMAATGDGSSTRSPPAEAERLRSVHESYLRRHDFEAGQLVQWKTGLRNKRLPTHGQPAIVIDVLGEAVLNTAEPPDSPYFREPLDVIVGVLDGEQDMAFFHIDSRRLEPAAENASSSQ